MNCHPKIVVIGYGNPGRLDDGLGPALAEAKENFERYLPEQQAAFAYTFYEEPDSTAAERGADAIAQFLQGRNPG